MFHCISTVKKNKNKSLPPDHKISEKRTLKKLFFLLGLNWLIFFFVFMCICVCASRCNHLCIIPQIFRIELSNLYYQPIPGTLTLMAIGYYSNVGVVASDLISTCSEITNGPYSGCQRRLVHSFDSISGAAGS